MPEEISRDGPITAPFAEPSQLGSRDILRLLSRAWPFVRPYRRDLVRLFVLLLPGAATGLFGLVLIRIFFDVIGNGQPLTAYEAWLLRLPLNASPPDGTRASLPRGRRDRAGRSSIRTVRLRLCGLDTAADQ